MNLDENPGRVDPGIEPIIRRDVEGRMLPMTGMTCPGPLGRLASTRFPRTYARDARVGGPRDHGAREPMRRSGTDAWNPRFLKGTGWACFG